ncbi:MAG: hypothetical protein AB7P76_12635 [Candidatus Melainabacteria bacterium]
MTTRLTVSQAVAQWLACAEEILAIPAEVVSRCHSVWVTQPPEWLTRWAERFAGDVFESRNGYPVHPIAELPYTETTIHRWLSAEGERLGARLKPQRPGLCLTHDIDYLQPTWPMKLKRLVAQRRWERDEHPDAFLDSLETLLQTDRDVAGEPGRSTLFIPLPERSAKPLRHLQQWLIDPSYDEGHPLFARLVDLVRRYGCEVGLHGSFYSLSDGLLPKERRRLSAAFHRPVNVVRQHWLNLPGGQVALEKIAETGFTVDSTLGWNGGVGFRGGMARPFTLLLPSGARIREMPLLLMDGPLFDDLALATDAVVVRGCELLEVVRQAGGCVAINWHERVATPGYAWHHAYREILDWAKAQSFDFPTISEAATRTENAILNREVLSL